MSTTQMLINPPSDVHTSVAAVIEACHKWEPTDVPVPAKTLPPAQPAPGLTEADVCGFIQHPAAQFWGAVNIVLMLAFIVAMSDWAFRWHRLPGAIWRLAQRLGRRTA